jgi:hypothetical protein
VITSLPRCRGRGKGRPETGMDAAGLMNDPSQSSGLRFPFECCLSALGRAWLSEPADQSIQGADGSENRPYPGPALGPLPWHSCQHVNVSTGQLMAHLSGQPTNLSTDQLTLYLLCSTEPLSLRASALASMSTCQLAHVSPRGFTALASLANLSTCQRVN